MDTVGKLSHGIVKQLKKAPKSPVFRNEIIEPDTIKDSILTLVAVEEIGIYTKFYACDKDRYTSAMRAMACFVKFLKKLSRLMANFDFGMSVIPHNQITQSFFIFQTL